jgi:hypothetical protein
MSRQPKSWGRSLSGMRLRNSYHFKFTEELQTELAQILAKRHAEKQAEKPGDVPC